VCVSFGPRSGHARDPGKSIAPFTREPVRHETTIRKPDHENPSTIDRVVVYHYIQDLIEIGDMVHFLPIEVAAGRMRIPE
jgi:hypothetical protein